jgi:hypothetical protein
MYRLMNDCCDDIIAELDRISDVPRYLDIRRQMTEVNVARDVAFQRAYRTYWRMNVTQLGDMFYSQYFARLETLKGGEIADVNATIREIAVLSDTTERPSLQFSFATKFVNTIDPRAPVYDSFVSAFFFFVPPASDHAVQARLDELIEFYDFLRGEYGRVLDRGLLDPAIGRFREHFAVDDEFCNERVVDLLVWSFASLLRNGAHRHGKALYR